MRDRILIVEDSELVTEAFSILLTEAGYDVVLAASVGEAVERATSQTVDLMLLDLSLPDGNGLDVLAALRKKRRLPRATLAMTGHDDSQTRRSCIAEGCSGVLLKPVPIRDLLRQIESLLA